MTVSSSEMPPTAAAAAVGLYTGLTLVQYVSAVPGTYCPFVERSYTVSLTRYGHIKIAEQRTIIQQYGDWYTGR